MDSERLPARHCSQPSVVSGDWLESQRGTSDLIVVDIRPAGDFAAGQVPGSVNLPFDPADSIWAVTRDQLLLEVPDATTLSANLGKAGIGRGSQVVVVTAVGQPPYPQAAAARVAVTLRHAGVTAVSVLDGGYPAWVSAGLPVSAHTCEATPGILEVSPSVPDDRDRVTALARVTTRARVTTAHSSTATTSTPASGAR